MSYYYDAAPRLRWIADRLELSMFEAQRKKRCRRRELSKSPERSGPSPEEIEIETLREAVNQALFALRLLIG